MYLQPLHWKVHRTMCNLQTQFIMVFSPLTAGRHGNCGLQVTDVSDGREATGKANSIKLSTATGHISYLAESETAQVCSKAVAHLSQLNGPHLVCCLSSQMSTHLNSVILRPACVQVEWVSAIEGAVARIVKQAAGLDEEEAPPSGGGGGGKGAQDWARQLEKGFAALPTSGGRSSSGRRVRPASATLTHS